MIATVGVELVAAVLENESRKRIDAAKRRSQVMCDRVTERLELAIRRLRRVLRGHQSSLGSAPLGDVVRDVRRADLFGGAIDDLPDRDGVCERDPRMIRDQ